MANIQIKDDHEFIPDAEMRKIAERVVRAYPEVFGHVNLARVAFMWETTGEEAKCGRDRVAAGGCFKVKSIFRDLLSQHGGRYDFIIAFFSSECEGKSLEWRQLLMYHELRHIDEDGKIYEHEIEDFVDVLEMGGIRWTDDQNVPDIIHRKIKIAD